VVIDRIPTHKNLPGFLHTPAKSLLAPQSPPDPVLFSAQKNGLVLSTLFYQTKTIKKY
jgi:hypothetical protein